MKNLSAVPFAFLLLVACGTDGSESDRYQLGSAANVASRPLVECAAEARPLTAVWSVGNGHGAVQSMALGPAGEVALAAADGSIKVWNLVSQSVDDLGVAPASGGVYGSEFGESENQVVTTLAFVGGDRIVAGDLSGNVRLHSVGDGQLLALLPLGTEAITTAAPNPAEDRIAVASKAYAGDLAVWTPASGDLVSLTATQMWFVESAMFTADGSRLLVGGEWYGVPAVEIWDTADFSAPLAFWRDFSGLSAARIVSMALSPDETTLYAVGGDEWDAEAGFIASIDVATIAAGGLHGDVEPVLASAELIGHAATSVSGTPAGELLATAGQDGTVRVFDSTTLSEMLRLDAAGSSIASITDDGARVVSSGADGALRLWGCP